MSVNLSRARWRKSSRSDTGSDKWWCVEVAGLPAPAGVPGTVVAVRDSKNPEGGELVFDVREWRAFIGGVKVGEHT